MRQHGTIGLLFPGRYTGQHICGVHMVTPVKTLLADVKAGHRLTEKEALVLFSVRDRQVWDIAGTADEVREQRAGPAVTYVRNQNINVTNLCVNACGFCGYSKKPGDEGIYFHDKAEIQRKVALATERKCTEICTVSGLHPDFTAQSYTDVYRWIHEAAPKIHLHASNPMEVAYAAKKSRMSTVAVLEAMKEAGLNSMCDHRHAAGHAGLRHGDDLPVRPRRVAGREGPVPARRALRHRPGRADPGTDDDVVLARLRQQPWAGPAVRAQAFGGVYRP